MLNNCARLGWGPYTKTTAIFRFAAGQAGNGKKFNYGSLGRETAFGGVLGGAREYR
jgi:hypothetical protein